MNKILSNSEGQTRYEWKYVNQACQPMLQGQDLFQRWGGKNQASEKCHLQDSIENLKLCHDDNVVCVSEFSMCLESIYLEVFNALFFLREQNGELWGWK